LPSLGGAPNYTLNLARIARQLSKGRHNRRYRADEGAFLVSSDGTQQVRFANSLASGDRKLLMAVPDTLSTNLDWTLEVRNRTKGAAPTAPLYVGYWGAVLHSA